jgi:hypothetical protein
MSYESGRWEEKEYSFRELRSSLSGLSPMMISCPSRVTVYTDQGIQVHVIPPGPVCWGGGKGNWLENNEMAGDRFKMERKSFSAEAKCIINSLIETDTSNGSPTQCEPYDAADCSSIIAMALQ